MTLGYTGTAQASTTIVDGGGIVTDDWGDHAEELGNSLCNGCADSQNTDLVLMWQTILYAEGFLVKSAIDGYFGSGTTTATKKWQLRYNLTGDGKVGPATWRAADNRLGWVNTTDHGYAVEYDASGNGKAWFQRGNSCCLGSDGNYRALLAHNGGGNSLVYFEYKEIQLFKRTISRK